MKKILVFLAWILIVNTSVIAGPIDTVISIKNSDASYLTRGECSVAFDMVAFDDLSNVNKIAFHYSIKSKKGKLISKGIEVVSEFNIVGGKTYAQFFLEGEEACKAISEDIYFSEVLVFYNDGTKPEDLVKSKKIVVSDFRPMKIIIPK